MLIKCKYETNLSIINLVFHLEYTYMFMYTWLSIDRYATNKNKDLIIFNKKINKQAYQMKIIHFICC